MSYNNDIFEDELSFSNLIEEDRIFDEKFFEEDDFESLEKIFEI